MLKPRTPQCLVLILAIISICFFSSTAFAQYGIFEKTADWGLEPQFPPKQGNYKVPGSISVTGTGASAVYELRGNGASERTESYYAYKNLTGSYAIQAKVNWIDTGGGSNGARIGLAIREKGESTYTSHYLIAMDGSNVRSDVIWEDKTSGNIGAIAVWKPDGDLLKNPGTGIWFRVSRIDPQDLFTFEYSLDGANWIAIDKEKLIMADEIAYGLFINNGLDNELLSRGTFTDVSIYPAFTGTRMLSQRVIQPGEKASVTLEILNPNNSSLPVSVTEHAPEGLSISDINHSGILSGNTITWNFSASPGTTSLTYQITPAISIPGSLTWNGNVNTFPIGGQNSVYIYKSSAVSDPNFTSLAEIIPSEHPNHKDGSATYDAYTNTYTIAGNGNDIGEKNDELLYLYKPVSGSWRAEATLEWDAVTNDWAKIGVMCRETVDPHSPQIGVFYRGLKDLIHMAVRSTFQSSTQETSSTLPSNLQGTPARIRLSRFSNEGMFLGEWYDSNQNAWIPIWKIRADLPDAVLLGLAITSHVDDDSTLASGKVKDFTFTPIPFTIRRNTAKQVVSKQDTLPVEVVIEIDSKNPSNLNAIETIPPNVQVTGISASTGSASLNGKGELVWTASNAIGRQILRYTLNVNWPETGVMYLKGTTSNGNSFQTDIQDSLVIVSDLETEDEFNGPFANWMDLKRDFGAKGDGINDDTQALQSAFDRLKADNATADRVLYIPAGIYRITQSLKLLGVAHMEALGFEIIGEDPATTTIYWDGKLGDPMIQFSAWNCKVSRLTLDGNGLAETGILWGPRFSTYSEVSDLIFRDLSVGIQGGINENNGIAEVSVLRCKFIRCEKAGISIENWNSLDWWIWYCTFEYCGRSVTNYYGAGNFYVYNSLFYKSQIADISIGNTGYYSFRENTSIQSKSFCTTGFNLSSNLLTIENNKIYFPQSTPIVTKECGSIVMYDNLFAYNLSPVVDVENPEGRILATGNTFTNNNPIKATDTSNVFENNMIGNEQVQISYPALPQTPPKVNRPIIEIPKDGDEKDIQEAINQADKMRGQKAIVHFKSGSYSIKNTLNIPANSDIKLYGDSTFCTRLNWHGVSNGLMLKLNGPSYVVISNLHFYGPTVYEASGTNTDAKGLLIDNCDQKGSRIFLDQIKFHDDNATDSGIGFFADKIINTDISLFDTDNGSQKICFKVTGNGDLTAARNSEGRIVVFSGTTGDVSDKTYDISQGGRLLVRDVWYEAHRNKKYFILDGLGDFTLQGAMVAPDWQTDQPMLEFNGFQGNVAFISSFINPILTPDSLVPISIKGDEENANLMFLGCVFNKISTRSSDHTVNINNESPNTVLSILESQYSTETSSGNFRMNNQGSSSHEFIKQMLEHTRKEHPRPLTAINQSGVTDIQMHRVIFDKLKVGLQLSHDQVDAQVPTYPNLGIFEKSSNWARYGSHLIAGTLDVQENNGNPMYTLGGNGDGVGRRDYQAPTEVDEAFYVYKESTGNLSIQAKVEWLDKTSQPGGVGVGLMIRDRGDNETSNFCFLRVPENEDVVCHYRETETGDTQIAYGGLLWKWLRLSRIDQSTFCFEISQDGNKWKEILRKEISMSDKISYGICCYNGYDNELLAKAKVTDVKIVKVEDTYTPTPTSPPTATPISGNAKVLYSNDFNIPTSNIPHESWPEWIDFGGNTAKAINGRIEWYDSGGNDDWLRLDKQLPTNFVMEFDFFYQENINGRFSIWPLVKPGESIFERANYFLRKDTNYFNGSNTIPSAGPRDLTLPIGSNPHRLRFEVNGDRVVFQYKNRGEGNWILIDERDFPPFGNSPRYIQLGYNHDDGMAGIHWIDNIIIMEQIQTPTSTPTLTIAPVSTPTRKPTATPTATYTKMPTFTPTPSLPGTPTNTSSPSFTPTFTHTPSPSHTPTFTPSPTPIPILTRWEFNTDNDLEGWQGSGIANLAVSGGILTGAAETNDPLLQKMGINVPTRYISGIAVRFRANQASALQVFIATLNGEWKFQYIQDLPYSENGEFQTYVIPLALNGAENQVLDLLRIDPAVAPGVQFEIDWIGLISSGVLQPTPTLTPIPAPTPTYSPTPKPVGIPGWEIY